MTFEEPDLLSFPCLDIARQTLGKGSQFAVTLNAANEVAVEAFLAGRIGFMDIPDLVSRLWTPVRPSPRPRSRKSNNWIRKPDATSAFV